MTADRSPLWAYALTVLTFIAFWPVYFLLYRWVQITVRRAWARRCHVAPVIPLRERSRT